MLASCSAGRVPQQRKGEGALVGPCIKECGHCGGPVDGTGADLCRGTHGDVREIHGKRGDMGDQHVTSLKLLWIHIISICMRRLNTRNREVQVI